MGKLAYPRVKRYSTALAGKNIWPALSTLTADRGGGTERECMWNSQRRPTAPAHPSARVSRAPFAFCQTLMTKLSLGTIRQNKRAAVSRGSPFSCDQRLATLISRTNCRSIRLIQALIVNGEIEERVHHLVPGLLAESHFSLRIRITRIVRRVVVVRDGFDARAFRNGKRRLRIVVNLPIEVIPRHGQQNLGSPVRIDRSVSDVLAAKVHMRHQADDV